MCPQKNIGYFLSNSHSNINYYFKILSLEQNFKVHTHKLTQVHTQVYIQNIQLQNCINSGWESGISVKRMVLIASKYQWKFTVWAALRKELRGIWIHYVSTSCNTSVLSHNCTLTRPQGNLQSHLTSFSPAWSCHFHHRSNRGIAGRRMRWIWFVRVSMRTYKTRIIVRVKRWSSVKEKENLGTVCSEKLTERPRNGGSQSRGT